MIQNILLATDGSASAERAADFAASQATRYGAKVTVLHAFTPVPSYLGEPDYSRRLYKTLDEAESVVADVPNVCVTRECQMWTQTQQRGRPPV